MIGRSKLSIAACIAVTAVCFVAWPAFAQDQPPPPPQPPPPSPQEPAKPKPNTDSAAQSAPDQPKWDPLRAEKDLQVGKYYMDKGDLDAAIDRFMDAADSKPGYAIPYRYLGEV